MHELTSAAEMKRLYGAMIDAAIKVDVPGIDIRTQHKYAFNILLDFKPGEQRQRLKKRQIGRSADSGTIPRTCAPPRPVFLLPVSSPEKPIKIVQVTQAHGRHS